MKPIDRDRVLTLFQIAAEAPDDSAHVADDNELLTAWRLGTLSPAEDDRFFAHLAVCRSCCQAVVELASLLPEAPTEPATPAPARSPSRRRRYLWTAVVAVAACIVIALAWALNGSPDAKEVARAQRDLKEGRVEDALVRLQGIRPDRLRTEEQRAEFIRVQEEATFRAALADLKAGRYNEAATRCLAARTRGVESARLVKLLQIATAAPTERDALRNRELPLLEHPPIETRIESHLDK